MEKNKRRGSFRPSPLELRPLGGSLRVSPPFASRTSSLLATRQRLGRGYDQPPPPSPVPPPQNAVVMATVNCCSVTLSPSGQFWLRRATAASSCRPAHLLSRLVAVASHGPPAAKDRSRQSENAVSSAGVGFDGS